METAELTKIPPKSSWVARLAGYWQKPDQTAKPTVPEEPVEVPPPVPVEKPLPPAISGLGREKRLARMAAYQAGKPAAPSTKLEETTSSPTTREATPSASLNQGEEFKEVRHTGRVLRLTNQEIPWLSARESEECPLVLITMADTKGSQVYFGSFIRGKVKEAASKMTPEEKHDADTLLYKKLPGIAQKGKITELAQMVLEEVSDQPVYYYGNRGGLRVYIMQRDSIDGIPVIVRVGVCNKNGEADLLSTISKMPFRRIKKSIQ